MLICRLPFSSFWWCTFLVAVSGVCVFWRAKWTDCVNILSSVCPSSVTRPHFWVTFWVFRWWQADRHIAARICSSFTLALRVKGKAFIRVKTTSSLSLHFFFFYSSLTWCSFYVLQCASYANLSNSYTGIFAAFFLADKLISNTLWMAFSLVEVAVV